MLHVHPKSQHRCRAGRLRPLFTGEQQQEGIWLLHWQGSLRRQPCKRRGGASGSASPVSLGTAFFFLLFFFPSCVCTSVCTGLLGETPGLQPTLPSEGCKVHEEYPGAFWPCDEPAVARGELSPARPLPGPGVNEHLGMGMHSRGAESL